MDYNSINNNGDNNNTTPKTSPWKVFKALLFAFLLMTLFFIVQNIAAVGSVIFSAAYAIVRALQGDEYYMSHPIMDFALGKDGLMLATLLATIFSALVFGMWWYARNRNYGRVKYRLSQGFKFLYKHLFKIILLFIAVYGITEIVVIIETFVFPEQLMEYDKMTENMVFDNLVVNIFALVIFGPLGEEALFRGMILDKFRGCMNIFVAIALQAVLFGAFHGNIIQGLFTIPMGFACGFLAYKGESIIPSLFVHMLYNGLALLISYLPKEISNSPTMAGAMIIMPIFAGFMLFTLLPRDEYGNIIFN